AEHGIPRKMRPAFLQPLTCLLQNSCQPQRPVLTSKLNKRQLGKIMRKRRTISESRSVSDQAWLNLETAATLELTSEDEHHPIEAALSSRGPRGWRAAGPGPQTIR